MILWQRPDCKLGLIFQHAGDWSFNIKIADYFGSFVLAGLDETYLGTKLHPKELGYLQAIDLTSPDRPDVRRTILMSLCSSTSSTTSVGYRPFTDAEVCDAYMVKKKNYCMPKAMACRPSLSPYAIQGQQYTITVFCPEQVVDSLAIVDPSAQSTVKLGAEEKHTALREKISFILGNHGYGTRIQSEPVPKWAFTNHTDQVVFQLAFSHFWRRSSLLEQISWGYKTGVPLCTPIALNSLASCDSTTYEKSNMNVVDGRLIPHILEILAKLKASELMYSYLQSMKAPTVDVSGVERSLEDLLLRLKQNGLKKVSSM